MKFICSFSYQSTKYYQYSDCEKSYLRLYYKIIFDIPENANYAEIAEELLNSTVRLKYDHLEIAYIDITGYDYECSKKACFLKGITAQKAKIISMLKKIHAVNYMKVNNVAEKRMLSQTIEKYNKKWEGYYISDVAKFHAIHTDQNNQNFVLQQAREKVRRLEIDSQTIKTKLDIAKADLARLESEQYQGREYSSSMDVDGASSAFYESGNTVRAESALNSAHINTNVNSVNSPLSPPPSYASIYGPNNNNCL